MSHFKAGDLALIVGTSGRNPETLGMCVELKRPLITHKGEKSWYWNGSPSPVGTLEIHLMPLRGDFQPEQEKQKDLLK